MENQDLKFNHVSVLLNECIENLNIQPNGIYIDGTLGGAGHSFEIAKRLSKNGKLIGIDRDVEAITVAKQRLNIFSNIEYIHGNHDDIKDILDNLNIDKVDGILLDLGMSSYQIDEKSRGFSYMTDSRLDMRMNQEQTLDAVQVLNTYKEEKLSRILYEYGEEKFSRQIAKNICQYRKNKTIDTTSQLVEIIEKSIPASARDGKGHPAKKTFQAIRIEVNNEIEPLYNTVINCIKVLKQKGRLCIITFHSLEDRAVKMAYTDALGKCTCPKEIPYCICKKEKLGKIITKKPILPTQEELNKNTRSKSAKLRVFEKI